MAHIKVNHDYPFSYYCCCYCVPDGRDLLDHISRGVQVDEALVDAELKGVEGVGALTARGLAGSDTQGLGGHAHGALDLQGLVLGTADEVGADCGWVGGWGGVGQSI